MSDYSIVEYFQDESGHKCGYCKGEDTNLSIGMWTHSLTVEDYQNLIDRGWRRSGKYCYKPQMDKTCCPQYTIRCRVADFSLSKSHKKVIKRNNHYFSSGVRPAGSELRGEAEGRCSEAAPSQDSAVTIDHVDLTPTSSQEGTTDLPPTTATSNKQHCDKTQHSAKPTPKSGSGADPDKPVCKKAKLLRQEKRQQKLQQQAEGGSTMQTVTKPSKVCERKDLQTLLSEIQENAKHKMEIRLVRSSPPSQRFRETYDETYQLWKKYQMDIHQDPEDDCEKSAFDNFLVESPLEPVYNKEGFPDGFGTFHQQYLMDGRIIAVGVVDILPHCMSSVYLYYDPDFSFLSLGTYSALREVAYTQFLHTMEPSLEYYYMGFYIHSCPKMKYKGHYTPSFLLCPESYLWVPIEQCRPKLDTKKYNRFDETGADDVAGRVILSEVLCMYKRQIVPYVLYRAFSSTDDSDDVTKYASLVGMTCARKMLLYRSGSARD